MAVRANVAAAAAVPCHCPAALATCTQPPTQQACSPSHVRCTGASAAAREPDGQLCSDPPRHPAPAAPAAAAMPSLARCRAARGGGGGGRHGAQRQRRAVSSGRLAAQAVLQVPQRCVAPAIGRHAMLHSAAQERVFGLLRSHFSWSLGLACCTSSDCGACTQPIAPVCRVLNARMGQWGSHGQALPGPCLPIPRCMCFVSITLRPAGPWKNAWTRRGYDPRSAHAARQWQCIEYHLPSEW